MIIGRQSGLGRGLGALIPPKSAPAPRAPMADPEPVAPYSGEYAPEAPVSVPEPVAVPSLRSRHEVQELPIESVDPNPHQPRVHFDHAQLEDLISSIQLHGVLQPIVVTRKDDGRYELIAGERRLRASKLAGLETIPALVRTATEQQKLELAIIENVQRQDLNPIEEAESYLRLQNEFNLTQDEVGKKVGKSRPQVGNIIRLLQLPQEIKDALMQGKISTSNARTLLSIESPAQRMELFQRMLEGNFTVRQAEAHVTNKRERRSTMTDPNVAHAESTLRAALGMKVKIKRDLRGEGEVRISFQNDEDFQTVLRKIAGEM